MSRLFTRSTQWPVPRTNGSSSSKTPSFCKRSDKQESITITKETVEVSPFGMCLLLIQCIMSICSFSLMDHTIWGHIRNPPNICTITPFLPRQQNRPVSPARWERASAAQCVPRARSSVPNRRALFVGCEDLDSPSKEALGTIPDPRGWGELPV